MTLDEILLRTQGKRAGIINQASLRYAQKLLLPEKVPSAAVIANLTAGAERFPGAVVLTDRRILAVCGLPGIKRYVSCASSWRCQEDPSAIRYKFTFSDGNHAFSMTVDPDTGEQFARCLAAVRGEADAFDAAGAGLDSGILNPALLRSKRRIRAARETHRAAEAARTPQGGPAAESDSQETAQRLARQLEAAKAAGPVDDRDPRAVAARLAAELAEQDSNS